MNTAVHTVIQLTADVLKLMYPDSDSQPSGSRAVLNYQNNNQ